MKLITKEIERAAPPLHGTDGMAPEDIKIVAKLFTPDANHTWYLTEYDPATREGYGLCRITGMDDCVEMGYISLPYIETLRGRLGLPVERDMYYGDHTLAEVKAGERTAR